MFRVKSLTELMDRWTFSWRLGHDGLGVSGEGSLPRGQGFSSVTKAVEVSGGDGDDLAPGTLVSGTAHSPVTVARMWSGLRVCVCVCARSKFILGNSRMTLTQQDPGNPSLII